MSTLEIKFLTFRVHRFGDAKAFRRLYELHAGRIRHYIAFRVKRVEDADELTSEVFLRVWEYVSVHKVDNVTALFFKIARNLIVDHYRKDGRTVPLTPVIEAELAAPGSVTDQLQIKEEATELIEAMKQLTLEQQEVLRMRYLDEMSAEEIGEQLDRTPNSVRVILHRAKQALKKQV